MPSAQEYQQLINSSPNLRKFLGLISYVEGANYNTGYGGRFISDLSWHPYPQRAFRLSDGSTTSAAGKYQFERGTWDSVARRLGLSNFQPTNQDIAAVALIDSRGALSDVLNGNVRNAVQKLKPEWQGFITHSISDILTKWGASTDTKQQTSPVVPNVNSTQSGKVISTNTRYLIAFAILAIIFVFAFN